MIVITKAHSIVHLASCSVYFKLFKFTNGELVKGWPCDRSESARQPRAATGSGLTASGRWQLEHGLSLRRLQPLFLCFPMAGPHLCRRT